MSDVIGLATLLSVVAAVLQLTALRKQRRRAFEQFFMHRYWQIMDGMSLEGAMGRRLAGLEVSPEDKRAVIAYLRLSEDEADLRARGWISTDTWALWWEGVATQLQRWPFDEVWADVYEYESQPERQGEDQFRILRKEAAPQGKTKNDFDPIPAWRHRWWWLFTGP